MYLSSHFNLHVERHTNLCMDITKLLHVCRFNWNYGVLGVLDRLHGTDRLFRENEAYKRHNVLLGLTPARQLVPDVAKTPPQGKQ